jgi:hypothetical protein
MFVGADNDELTSRARTAFEPMMIAVVIDAMNKHPATTSRTQPTFDALIT